ncbi:hypothetical protein CPB97_001018 [Podila verticillata]|nr:hypothetical protein CPB97_001018 [Podila verticillata]
MESGNDEKHVLKIFGLNKGFKDAIKAHVDMFPIFNWTIAFVHIHFDYKNFHPARLQVAHAVDFRTQCLHEIMGWTTFPHFKIDCDIYSNKPIRDCITQNTAKNSRAGNLQPTYGHVENRGQQDSQNACDIDNILRDKFEATSLTIEKTLRFKDKEEGDLLAEIFRNEATVHKLGARIKVLDEFFVRHDVELLEILHEERRDMDYAVDNQGKFLIRYPQQGEQRHTIKQRDLLRHSVDILNADGSDKDKEGWKSWKGDFQRTSLQNSVLHVKIYASKSNLYEKEIEEKHIERLDLKQKLAVAIEYRRSHSEANESRKQQIKEIVDNHSEGIQILGYVANDVLTPDLFNALMGDEAYIGDTAVCSKKVQMVYMRLAKEVNAAAAAAAASSNNGATSGSSTIP